MTFWHLEKQKCDSVSSYRQKLLHLRDNIWLGVCVLHLVGDLLNLAVQLVYVSSQHIYWGSKHTKNKNQSKIIQNQRICSLTDSTQINLTSYHTTRQQQLDIDISKYKFWWCFSFYHRHYFYLVGCWILGWLDILLLLSHFYLGINSANTAFQFCTHTNCKPGNEKNGKQLLKYPHAIM